jgi:hypothetical protein
VNTGTWRDRILTTPDDRTFGRINALTYVELLSSSERTAKNGEASDSFAYWNGVTRDWPENPNQSHRPKLGLGRRVSLLAQQLIHTGKR